MSILLDHSQQYIVDDMTCFSDELWWARRHGVIILNPGAEKQA
jgi:hypothetical protein